MSAIRWVKTLRVSVSKRIALLMLLATALPFIGCRGESETKAGTTRANHAVTTANVPDRQKARLPSETRDTSDPSDATPDDWFEAKTKSGINFSYRDGSEAGFYQFIESVGGGAALLDFDGDDDLDVFVTGGGKLEGTPLRVKGLRCALFRNDGAWKFVDVTTEIGLADDSLYTHGCAAADYDNDGRPDLFVAGYGGCRLYHNEGATFKDVTREANMECPGWNVAATWADYDRDGFLDLYVVTYAQWQPDATEVCQNDKRLQDVCPPVRYQGTRDHLFRNTGQGSFEDVTEEAGLVERNRGMGVVAADVDENGWVDFYVVNDVEENQLYMNKPALPFAEQAVVQGVAYSLTGEREGSMGVDVGDFNGDELPDLWYTNYANQDNSLLRNTGKNGFVSAAPVTGLMGVSRQWVGFGTCFADFDHDGWQDLFVANGHVMYERQDSPYYQPAQLFKNSEGKRYLESTAQGGPYFSVRHAGRGAALGDLDNDGALDLVVVHQNDPAELLRNRLPAKNWIRLKLRGIESNRDGIGAKVTAKYEDRPFTTWVRSGSGYASSFDLRVIIPQPGPEPAAVSVLWPSGKRELFDLLDQGSTHELIEGQGKDE